MRSKGQFFIISTVVIVTTLLAVYAIYQGYYKIDTSEVQSRDEAFLIKNFETESREIFDSYAQDNCTIFKDRIGTFQLTVQSQTRQRAEFLVFNPNTTRGCMWTNFSIDLKTKETRVIKKWDMKTIFTPGTWGLDSQSEFDGEYENLGNNITVNADGSIELIATATEGSISYHVGEDGPFDNGVWWILHQTNISAPRNTTVTFNFKTNHTGSWTTYTFDRLPDEKFIYLNQTIELKRKALSDPSPKVFWTNVTWATKPCGC